MIRSFRVSGLHGRADHDITLHEDLNVLTGRNGTGKTTILKLLWYMISPNVERTVPEILFREAEVITDEFSLTISRPCKNDKEKEMVNFTFRGADEEELVVEVPAHDFNDPLKLEQVEEINRKIDPLPSGSVFFPTFRRIEGGFSIGERRHMMTYSQSIYGSLSEVMSAYANTIGVHQHRFIASISTEDIERLLTREYADVSEKANGLHLELSRFISSKVGHDKRHAPGTKADAYEIEHAHNLIDEIRSKVIDVDKRRASLMSPFDVLTQLIVKIFKDKGITVSKALTFGETKEAIRASILSAGEKQMLSFLCYNAFTTKNPIFIDEPELSLHGDWQRILFPTLLSQGTGNQFIVSTHSPFIYSKYPEKEIQLYTDRGE